MAEGKFVNINIGKSEGVNISIDFGVMMTTRLLITSDSGGTERHFSYRNGSALHSPGASWGKTPARFGPDEGPGRKEPNEVRFPVNET